MVFANFKRVHEARSRASWPQGCHGGIEEMRQEPRELSKQFTRKLRCSVLPFYICVICIGSLDPNIRQNMEVERAAMRLSMPYIQRSGVAMGPMLAVILILSYSIQNLLG